MASLDVRTSRALRAFVCLIGVWLVWCQANVLSGGQPTAKGGPPQATIPSAAIQGRQADRAELQFSSNSLLVKLKPSSRSKLSISATGDVDPHHTGLASLDAIDRDLNVHTFRSLIAPGAHRDPQAAIHAWYHVTLDIPYQRFTLVRQSPDDALNLAYSGAEPLGGLMKRLQQDPDVEAVTLDYVLRAQFIPNDPYYSSPYSTSKSGNISQWAPQFMGAPAAWDATLGDPSVIIAIVDTGIDTTHPDLAGKVVLATNFVKGEKARDSYGHGTHVAGIAAANTDNGIGVAGICPRCSLMSVKVLGADGSGTLSDVASGITYATDHGARVINMSLGSSARTQVMSDALDYALDNNVLPVAAMGNSSTDRIGEPAYWHSALSVGAVAQNGTKASFSNFGLQTGVAAPGVAVLSTMPTYPTTLTTTYGYKLGYDALSGTSMATPCIAGLAGLLFSLNPNLSATQVKGMIEASSGDGASFDTTFGFGIARAAGATSLASQAESVSPTLSWVGPPDESVLVRTNTFSTSVTDNVAAHHVDFVKDGARYLLPATATGYPGGKGKNPSPAIAPWTTVFMTTTVWNGLVPITATTVDRSGNLSTPVTRSFDVENAYTTKVFTTHVCDPARTGCPRLAYDASFALDYPAIAKERIEWFNSTFSSNYAGDVAGVVSDGRSTFSWGAFQRYWSTNVLEADFGRPVFCGGCSTNRIGAGLGFLYFCMNNDCPITPGTAETDITVTITYPQ